VATGKLEGKVAMVSGGSKGMGEAIVRLFAAEGATVFLTGRSLPAAAGVAESIGRGTTGVALEVSDRAAWQAAIGAIDQACGRLDILVNSAGVSVGGSIDDTSDENWRMHMSTNLDGVFYGCQSALPLMLRSGEPGSIVNISSVIASRPLGGLLAYGVSKAAVTALTKSIALH